MTPAEANMGSWFSLTKTTHGNTYPFISPVHINGSGRSVLITGAAKGIGRAIALSYAAAGFSKIAIAARSDLSSFSQELQQVAHNAGRATPKIVQLSLDVASSDSVLAAVDTLTREFEGTLDVLINNAGYCAPWVPMGESSPDEWWQTWDVNIRGPYLCCRNLLPLLLRSELKTIINVSSIGALAVAPGAEAYQASKLALCRLGEFLTVSYGDQGLVTISIHPGGVMTDLGKTMPEAFRKSLTDDPSLPGDTVAWLGSERRPWLSGRMVNVQWDMEELLKKEKEILEKDSLKFRLVF